MTTNIEQARQKKKKDTELNLIKIENLIAAQTGD